MQVQPQSNPDTQGTAVGVGHPASAAHAGTGGVTTDKSPSRVPCLVGTEHVWGGALGYGKAVCVCGGAPWRRPPLPTAHGVPPWPMKPLLLPLSPLLPGGLLTPPPSSPLACVFWPAGQTHEAQSPKRLPTELEASGVVS